MTVAVQVPGDGLQLWDSKPVPHGLLVDDRQAHIIMDNLLAEKRARPMIVVMPL